MRWLFPGWLVMCAAGCLHRTQVAPPQVVVVPGPAPVEPCSPLIGALGSVGLVLMMPKERQQQEIETLTANLARTDLVTDRVRLAFLLTLGDEGVRDAEGARALLEGRAWEDTSYEALARLILELLDERRARARDRLDLSFSLEQERREKSELAARLAEIRAIETEMDARELSPEANGETAYPLR